MVQISLAEMFSSLGWGSGFKLPVSNEVNARLERELEKKQRKALKLSSELDENNHYVGILNSQIERVEEQIELDQKIVLAKKSEVETEVNLQEIALRTLSKSQEDCKRLQKQVNETNSRNVTVSNALRKRQNVIDELVGIVQFDKNALERYRESIEEKENYITFIEQFVEMDKKSIEDCKKKYDKLASAGNAANNQLTSNYQCTIALQTQLDQNTSLLRRVNQERVDALEMWKSTLSSMKLRDEEMSQVSQLYADVRCRRNRIDEKIFSKREMLESEQRETKQRIRIRNLYDKNYSTVKEKLNEAIEDVRHMNEIQSKLKGEIKVFSHDAKTAKKKISSLEEEIEASQSKLKTLQEEVSYLKGRHEAVMGATMSSEERMKEVESLMDSELDNIETSISRLERERKFLYHRISQKTELINKLEQLDFGIRTRVSHIAALKEKMLKDESLLQRKTILLYQVELEAFQLNKRCVNILNPMANAHTDEIKAQQEQVASLKGEEESYENQRIYLLQEVKHISETVNKIMKHVRLAIADNQFLRGEALQDRIETDKFEADLKTQRKNMKDETVEYRLIQVQLKRINDLSKAQRSTMFDLEHNMLLMNSMAKEKKAEIDVHISLLTGKKRLVQEDRSKIKIEIADLHSTLERLKKKYDILMHTLNSEPGDNEIHSEAYYIIKQAEEAELLKQEGDLWDARVKEAEQEIIAIQNTLSLIFNSNNSFKDSLAPIVESSAESVAIKKLQEDSEMALVSKKLSNKERVQLTHQIEFIKEDIRKAAEDITHLNLECYDRKYELSAMQLDLENQNTKIRRANVMSNKILKELGPQSEHERNFIELDLKYLATKTKLEYALSTMERFVGMYPAVKCTVVEYLHVKDMKKAAARIMNSGKSGASSMASTPNRSGRATPVTGHSLRHKVKTVLPPPKSAKETNIHLKKEGIDVQSYNRRTDAKTLVNVNEDIIPKTITSATSPPFSTDLIANSEDIELQDDQSAIPSVEELDDEEEIANASLLERFTVPTNEPIENNEGAIVSIDRHVLRDSDGGHNDDADENLEDQDDK